MGKLGNGIKGKRKELKLKVYELANKVGVNPVFITQIEKGYRFPSEKILGKIGQVLGEDFRILYYLEKHPDFITYLIQAPQPSRKNKTKKRTNLLPSDSKIVSAFKKHFK
ncbi:MAG: helix-turn-helix transcriptional regulator [Candidatus Omnitrophota bacterium]|jgi:transcriptional regulator with XRE-family HTH domain